ncbi:restriction endonuclease subunit S, partial [Methanoculleus sp. MH98A]|uniref:restriction endonuclease subunit S n=1 Tax=Methanoculleus sp. MH98A TaxID=1495314 RepID=UPI00049F07BD
MQRTKLQPYDVLLNITGASIGRCTFVPQDFGEGNVNQHVCIIRLNDSGKPEFISSVLSSHIGQFQIESLQAGLSREGLNYRQVRSIKIPLPLLPEQHRIAAILTAAEDRIAREETYRDKLLAMKKGLMADLLTGRVRVPEGIDA